MKKALKFEMESSFKRQIQNLGHLDIGTEMTKIQNMSKLVQKKKKNPLIFFFFKILAINFPNTTCFQI